MRRDDPLAPTLAFVAAVALEDVVRDCLAENERETLQLKWPNDLLLGGAKLSGILLERSVDVVIVGIGVNVVHHPELADRATTSIAAHGCDVTAGELLDRLAAAFARWLGRWRSNGLASVLERWTARAHPRGSAIAANLPGGETIHGVFCGLAGDGALILRLADGTRRVIHAADVFLV